LQKQLDKLAEIGTTQLVVMAALVIAVGVLWGTDIVVPNQLEYNIANFTHYQPFETVYLYFFINFFAILFPFLLSFDRRVHFYRKWKYLLPALLLTALVFIPWDIYFTQIGVWGFNPTYYYESLKIFGLPLGEWLFFVTIPYGCVFIYECLNYYVKKDWLKFIEPLITYLLVLTLLTVSVIHWGKIYTVTTFLLTAALLMYYIFTEKRAKLSRFYLAFIVSMLPFFIVNGILTGGATAAPIVVYNNAENLGIRLGTIPLDDVVYCFLLLLMTVSWFEYFRKRDSP